MSVKDYSITQDLNPVDAKVADYLNSDLSVKVFFRDAPAGCKPIYLETSINKDGSLKSIDVRSEIEVNGKKQWAVIEPKVLYDPDDKANIEAKAAQAIEMLMDGKGDYDKGKATEALFHRLEDAALYNAIVVVAEQSGYQVSIGDDRQFQVTKGEPNGRIHREFYSNLAEVADAISKDVLSDVAKSYEAGTGCWKDDDRFALVCNQNNLVRLADVSIGEIGDARHLNIHEFRYEDKIRTSSFPSEKDLQGLSIVHSGVKVAGKSAESNEVLYGLRQNGFQVDASNFLPDAEQDKQRSVSRGR